MGAEGEKGVDVTVAFQSQHETSSICYLVTDQTGFCLLRISLIWVQYAPCLTATSL